VRFYSYTINFPLVRICRHYHAHGRNVVRPGRTPCSCRCGNGKGQRCVLRRIERSESEIVKARALFRHGLFLIMHHCVVLLAAFACIGREPFNLSRKLILEVVRQAFFLR
jgi:hypothetical protein